MAIKSFGNYSTVQYTIHTHQLNTSESGLACHVVNSVGTQILLQAAGGLILRVDRRFCLDDLEG